MTSCQNCGKALPEEAQFCPSCGTKVDPMTKQQTSLEQVLGTVLFGGYYKDICFTDRRVIQFETMRDRYKFLAKALGPRPLVVAKGGDIGDILPFLKMEIQRNHVTAIEIKNHGRFSRGRISIVKTSGDTVELARIDVDVSKEAFGELVQLLNDVYTEIKKTIL